MAACAMVDGPHVVGPRARCAREAWCSVSTRGGEAPNAHLLIRSLDTLVMGIENERDEARAEVKRLADQLGDALDATFNLREKIKVKDQIISELQAMQAQRQAVR